MGSVTFDIPDNVDPADAEAIVRSFLAAKKAADVEQETVAASAVTHADEATTDEQSVPHEDDEQTEQPDERSYSSVPSTMGSIPLVSMTVGAGEGGILGSLAAAREAEQHSELGTLLYDYSKAAREAAADPNRKRPPRAEPALVDSAVKSVMRLMHGRTKRYIMGEGDNGGEPEMLGGAASSLSPLERVRTNNVEQSYIAFTIREARRYQPYTMVNNNRSTGWGLIGLILKEYGAELTAAQVRASLKRLVDSGFICHNGMCGKQTRYTLCDNSEWIVDEDDYIA